MKYILALTFVCLLCSCKKEKAIVYASEGVITGVDMSECPCAVACPCLCGGLVFHFTDRTDTSRMALDNGAVFQLPENTQFPVRVKLNWLNTTRCDIKTIKVTSYTVF